MNKDKDAYTIEKVSEYGYKLKINNSNYKIIYKLLKIILKNVFFDEDTNSILFNAESLVELKDYLNEYDYRMPYDKCMNMINFLSKQINILKELGYSIYGFDIEDIIILDGSKFIFIGSKYLVDIVEDDMCIFYSPFEIPYFYSPEVFEINKLPSKIHFNSSYYSLGVLITFCILNKYLLEANEVKSESEIKKILAPLNNTKLYWFLQRCFEPICEKRILLLM